MNIYKKLRLSAVALVVLAFVLYFMGYSGLAFFGAFFAMIFIAIEEVIKTVYKRRGMYDPYTVTIVANRWVDEGDLTKGIYVEIEVRKDDFPIKMSAAPKEVVNLAISMARTETTRMINDWYVLGYAEAKLSERGRPDTIWVGISPLFRLGPSKFDKVRKKLVFPLIFYEDGVTMPLTNVPQGLREKLIEGARWVANDKGYRVTSVSFRQTDTFAYNRLEAAVEENKDVEKID